MIWRMLFLILFQYRFWTFIEKGHLSTLTLFDLMYYSKKAYSGKRNPSAPIRS